ncbi:MAG: translocation/assembly module TamB domain-containing protein, partial [Moraxellaceae bacterium]
VLDLSVKTPTVTAATQLAGGLDANLQWLGQLRNGQIDSRKIKLRQDRPAALIWNTDARAVQLDPHCWVSNGSRLCVVEPLQASPAKGYAAVRLQNLEIATFRDLMPTGMIWQGKLNGQAIGGWQQGQAPTLDAQIYTDNGLIGLTADDPQDPPLTVAYQRLSLVASTQEDGMRIRFDARTPNSGAGYIDGVIDPAAKTINGALVLDNMQLAVFKPFFPAMRSLSGIASVAGGMSGPLVGPQFYGNFKLRDGRVQLAAAPINLTKITLDASIRGTQATLTGAFNSGEGVGSLEGNAVWETTPEINLKLSGDQLVIRQAPMLNARVSPEIAVQILPQSRQVSVDGEIRIPRAVIAPPAASAQVVSVSPDVRVLDRRIPVVQMPTTDPALQAASPWRIDADLAVILGDAVEFRGFGARLPLAGRVNLRQRGLGNLTANGEVAVSRQSRVEAFGQSLLLRKGIARFTGSLTNPVLEIEAVRSIQDAVVGVKIGGNPTRPEINVFNDAGLTEQEALNALLTGRIGSNNSSTNTAGFKSEVNNTLAAAGLSFGLGGTRQFTNRIGQTFGLSGLAVDAEGVGNDTQVNVTGYITPDLYLRYGVGVFTPVNKLTLRYQINRRLYVEASSALEKAVDVFYNWRF